MKKVESMKQINTIDRTVVNNFIDKIIIGNDGNICIILKFGTSFDALLQNQMYFSYNGKDSIKELPFLNIKFIQNISVLFKFLYKPFFNEWNF